MSHVNIVSWFLQNKTFPVKWHSLVRYHFLSTCQSTADSIAKINTE